MTIRSQFGNRDFAGGMGRMKIGRDTLSRQLLIGVILILALLAFEMFNFDTTRYALQSLLGDVRFASLTWATILAVAFCAIDFAGLARLFTPERGLDEPKEVWYLTGAWLLGASMNAVMTWWAVSSVLVSHELGNEILGREQLLHIVPVFVAVLVWLTRILFIGALTIAGERILYGRKGNRPSVASGQTARTASATRQPALTGVAKSGGSASQSTPLSVAASRANTFADKTRVSRRPPRPVSMNKQMPRYQGTSSRRRD